jgi:hypothetical protein
MKLMKHWALLCGGFCLPWWAGAQSVHLFNIEPTIGLEGKLNNRLDYFFQISSESQFNHEELEDETFENGARNMDFQVGLATDLTADLSGSANFTFRLREPFGGNITTELRPTQQVTLATSKGKYRFRHRLRADERFIQRDPGGKHEFDLRLRYRLSLDFPLQGDRLDAGEFYLNTNAEFLYTPTRDDAFFYREYRGYIGLGYQFSSRYTLELGSTIETARISRELGRENVWLTRVVLAVEI